MVPLCLSKCLGTEHSRASRGWFRGLVIRIMKFGAKMLHCQVILAVNDLMR